MTANTLYVALNAAGKPLSPPCESLQELFEDIDPGFDETVKVATYSLQDTAGYKKQVEFAKQVDVKKKGTK